VSKLNQLARENRAMYNIASDWLLLTEEQKILVNIWSCFSLLLLTQ